MNDLKNHWEKVYTEKQPHEVSWTQDVPHTSLQFIRSFGLSKDAAIIDVGGGDSRLVDFLLEDGFTNITVLDISGKALERAQQRLGKKAGSVNWVASDVLTYNPDRSFDCWHDRAAFHFLTQPQDIDQYVTTVTAAVNGYLAIGTFSTEGPKKCSGLDITQYSEDGLSERFSAGFSKMNCITEDHITPFDTKQNFIFCSFKKAGHQ